MSTSVQMFEAEQDSDYSFPGLVLRAFPHASGVSPIDAWDLVQNYGVRLVDVRTGEERKFVGHVPGSLHIPWAVGTAFIRNPRFIKELEVKAGKDNPILLLCRSGKRSAMAMEAAIAAGFRLIANVSEGFEGDLDRLEQRGRHNGWRYRGLPWVQD